MEAPSPSPVTVPARSPGKNRLTHIDAIRGAMLVLMAVNHIPSPVHAVTNHPLGYVSAAEGFVFMSGLMSGWVYSKRYYRDGKAALREAAMRRALAVYLYHILTFIAVLGTISLLTHVFGIFPTAASDLMIDRPWSMLLAGLVFLQQPSLFDILPMYCVFLVVLPILILACARGQRGAVLTGSFIIWLLTNLYSPQTPFVSGMIDMGSFNLFAWQFLFVLGAVCGQAWAAEETFVPRVRGLTVALVLVPAAVLFAVRHAYVHPPISMTWLNWATNKNNVAPLRMVNSLMLYYLFYALASRFPQLMAWRSLALLGRNSIFVFAVHIAAAYVILSFPDALGATLTGQWIGTTLMIGSLFLAAGTHEWVSAKSKARSKSALASASLGTAR